jgi:hypothetical protein
MLLLLTTNCVSGLEFNEVGGMCDWREKLDTESLTPVLFELSAGVGVAKLV